MDFRVDPRAVLSAGTPAADNIRQRQLAKLKESTRELEVTFINEMVKAMRKTVPEGELFKKNSAEKMFEEMQDKELSRTMSSNQNFGLAAAMYRQMAPLVENRVYHSKEEMIKQYGEIAKEP